MRRLTIVAILALTLAAAVVAGCGSSSSKSGSSSSGNGSSTSSAPAPKVHFAKTKFLLHAGLAFGAFHRYIYKPYKAGKFSPPLQHKLQIVKAGAAALFAYHETKQALAAARGSKLLSKLLSPLLALQDKLSALGARLKSGHLDTAGIAQTNAAVGSVAAQAKADGAPVSDRNVPSIP
jgi:hypothetical protein